MTDEQGYNGWTNYETWSVALIINNDQGTQAEMEERVRASMRQAPLDYELQEYKVGDVEEHVRWDVAQTLRSWFVDELQPELDELPGGPWSYLWSQLLGAALSEVDWDDLAESFVRGVRERDAYEEVTEDA
jgi:hypothetical protein